MSYDSGFAPNPFHGYCTIATCKPRIRRNAKLGDWIVGSSSKSLKGNQRLIYLMQVEETLPLDEYWNDPRFSIKKPNLRGSYVRVHGDNAYHIEEGQWIQERCIHSLSDEEMTLKHIKKDTSGLNVLIGTKFYYFGRRRIVIPTEYLPILSSSRDYEKADVILFNEMLSWLSNLYEPGIHGDPISWDNYGQYSIAL